MINASGRMCRFCRFDNKGNAPPVVLMPVKDFSRDLLKCATYSTASMVSLC